LGPWRLVLDPYRVTLLLLRLEVHPAVGEVHLFTMAHWCCRSFLESERVTAIVDAHSGGMKAFFRWWQIKCTSN
jgi:hypothetical protein